LKTTILNKMGEEIKKQFKDLCISILILASLLTFLSYANELDDRITRLENIYSILLNNREVPNYYETLKEFESVNPEINELRKETK
jgi:hypothetical protein